MKEKQDTCVLFFFYGENVVAGGMCGGYIRPLLREILVSSGGLLALEIGGCFGSKKGWSLPSPSPLLHSSSFP